MQFNLEYGRYSKFIIYLWGTIDAILLIYSFHVVKTYRNADFTESFQDDFSWMVITILLWFSCFVLTKACRPFYFKRIGQIVRGLARVVAVFLPGFVWMLHMLGNLTTKSVNLSIHIFAVFLCSSFLLRVIQLFVYRKLRNLKTNQTRYVIVGKNFTGLNLYQYLLKMKYPGFIFQGYIQKPLEEELTAIEMEKFYQFCKERQVNQIYFALPENSKFFKQMSLFADTNFIHFGLVQTDFGLTQHVYPGYKLPVYRPI